MELLAQEERTIIIYESPYRVLKTLQAFVEFMGEERRAVACREISKLHQQYVRGTLKELIDHFTETTPRGEFVLLFAGRTPQKKVHKEEKKYSQE